MVHGWDKDNRSALSLSRNLPVEGPFVPCLQDVVQYHSSAYRTGCVRQKGLMEFFAPSLYFWVRLKAAAGAPLSTLPAPQVLYLSRAPRPGCAPRLWHSWHSTCNSASAPPPWLLQLLESSPDFCHQNL